MVSSVERQRCHLSFSDFILCFYIFNNFMVWLPHPLHRRQFWNIFMSKFSKLTSKKKFFVIKLTVRNKWEKMRPCLKVSKMFIRNFSPQISHFYCNKVPPVNLNIWLIIELNLCWSEIKVSAKYPITSNTLNSILVKEHQMENKMLSILL